MTKAHDEMVERLMPILWQSGDIPWRTRLSAVLSALTPADLALLAQPLVLTRREIADSFTIIGVQRINNKAYLNIALPGEILSRFSVALTYEQETRVQDILAGRLHKD